MKLESERMYLNQFSVWGAYRHDPAGTENIKAPKHFHVREFRVLPKPPTSRYISNNPATYLT